MRILSNGKKTEQPMVLFYSACIHTLPLANHCRLPFIPEIVFQTDRIFKMAAS